MSTQSITTALRRTLLLTRLSAVGTALLLVVACQRGTDASPPPEAPTKARKARGPDRQVFAPLEGFIDTASTQLPFLIQDEERIIEEPCFRPIDDVIVAEVTGEISSALEAQQRGVSRLLRQWVRQTVGPASVGSSAIKSWTIEPEAVVSLEIDDTLIRFVEEPECIDSSTGWLEQGVRVVAGLYGAKTFRFSTKTPIPRNRAEELLEEFTTAGLVATTEDFVDYEEVTDADGEPMVNDDGERIYRHPELGVVPASEITPPARQRMKAWIVEAPDPVIFAYRELNEVAWRREADRDACNVNIVWNDPVFRRPECAEFDATGFKAAKVGDGVEIEMQTDDEVETFEMDFGQLKRLRVNDRVILWISPVKIEEGALIRLNSLVLSP